MSERRIETGLKTDLDMAILDAVLGQLSDGMWENSPMMDKYWPYIEIEKRGGKVYLDISDSYRKYDYPRNGFMDMDDATIKTWLAKKLKAVIKEEGLDWRRDNADTTDYLSTDWRLPSKEEATVADCYYVYEVLRGRNVAKQPEYSKKMGLDEALDILKSAGKIIEESQIDIFGVNRIDRSKLTRGQIQRINKAKRALSAYLDAQKYYEVPRDIDPPSYSIKRLRDAGAFDGIELSNEEISDRIGVTDKREEFDEQKKEYLMKSRAVKKQTEEELIVSADMRALHGDRDNIVGSGTVIAYKDIDPSIIRFEFSWSYGDKDRGILPKLKGLYPGGWLKLGYGNLGRGDRGPEIPSWTADDSRNKNWPIKADAETLNEIHDFLKENMKYVDDQIRINKGEEEDIARDMRKYKGSNWSGD